MKKNIIKGNILKDFYFICFVLTFSRIALAVIVLLYFIPIKHMMLECLVIVISQSKLQIPMKLKCNVIMEVENLKGIY